MGVPPPPEYSSVVRPSAPSAPCIPSVPPMSDVPLQPPQLPQLPPVASAVPMSYPSGSVPMAAPPVYTQPVMLPYAVPMQPSPPAPVTNIVIQAGGGGGTTTGGGQIPSPLLCPKCKTGVLIKQRNKCVKVTIIVLVVITFPFGLLLLPLLCFIWQKKCPVCLRTSGYPIGMKNSR